MARPKPKLLLHATTLPSGRVVKRWTPDRQPEPQPPEPSK